MALRCCPYFGRLVHLKRGGGKIVTSDDDISESPKHTSNTFYQDEVHAPICNKEDMQREPFDSTYESTLSIEEIMRQVQLDLSWDNLSSSDEIQPLWSQTPSRPATTATQTVHADVHSIAFYANQPLWVDTMGFERCSTSSSELGLTDLEFDDQICEIEDSDEEDIPFGFKCEIACCQGLENSLEGRELKRYGVEENVCYSSLERILQMCACGGSDELLDTSTDTAITDCGSKFEDSGIGRTDESTKNDESSEQESPESYNMPSSTGDLVWSGRSQDTDDTSVFTFDEDIVQKFDVGQPMSPPTGHVCSCSESSSIEMEIAALNQEMDRIRLQCREIMELHNTEQCDAEKSETSPFVRVVPRMGTRLDHVVPRMGTRVDHTKQWQSFRQQLPIRRINHVQPTTLSRQEPVWFKRSEIVACVPVTSPLCRTAKVVKTAAVVVHRGDTSTSAYNTGGDSCGSTPVLSAEPLTVDHNSNFEQRQNSGVRSLQSAVSEKNDSCCRCIAGDMSIQRNPNCTGSQAGVLSQGLEAEDGTLSHDNQNYPQSESLKALYNRYVDVMYTNSANLQHTIMVQQKLFEQQVSTAKHSTHESTASMTNNDREKDTPLDQIRKSDDQCSSTGPASNLEWIVKRRSDGSRYITRRPIRKQILKERARKVAEERCGVTTDDDAASELKVGRYWSREERKQQLEKARSHRQHKKTVLRQQMETVGETEDQPNIVALSHQKVMRHKGRKVFDDFITLQEILAHGSRDLRRKSYNPLLSVTTV